MRALTRRLRLSATMPSRPRTPNVCATPSRPTPRATSRRGASFVIRSRTLPAASSPTGIACARGSAIPPNIGRSWMPTRHGPTARCSRSATRRRCLPRAAAHVQSRRPSARPSPRPEPVWRPWHRPILRRGTRGPPARSRSAPGASSTSRRRWRRAFSTGSASS